MTAKLCKAALVLVDVTQTQIARACGVEPNTVSAVVAGKGRSARIEKHIAQVTGLSRHELWPQWYGPGDKPLRRPRRHASRMDTMTRLAKLDQLTREAA